MSGVVVQHDDFEIARRALEDSGEGAFDQLVVPVARYQDADQAGAHVPVGQASSHRVGDHRGEELDADPEIHREVQNGVSGRGVVLPIEPQHAVVEGVVEARFAMPAARPALDVQDRDIRVVPRDPAGLSKPVAEVEVLHVHPVALVEHPDVVERPPADQHEGAVDRIDGSALDLWGSILREPRGAPVSSVRCG